MTATTPAAPRLAAQMVNGLLAIKPLAQFAKQQARQMMIQRAERMGVAWTQAVATLQARGDRAWETDLAEVQNPALVYPDYYLNSFHAYEQGNLSWEAAMEVEVAAYAVHARIWPDAGVQGDARLRQSFLELVQRHLPVAPQAILDLGCSVGMSTFALQTVYPQARITGLDLSPYFLAIARYRAQQQGRHSIRWLHAAGEQTGLPDAAFDLVAISLVYHELPQAAARQILWESRRLLRPQGHLALMDMNPSSEAYAQMPPYILALLKSTEPYLDDYFALDVEQAIKDAGFRQPIVACNSPRHRTFVAQVD